MDMKLISLTKRPFSKFVAKVLVFLMIINGLPLWELSKKYEIGVHWPKFLHDCKSLSTKINQAVKLPALLPAFINAIAPESLFAQEVPASTSNVNSTLGDGCFTRSPGYWSEHPDIAQKLFPVTSCAFCIDTIAESSEDLCFSSKDAKANNTSSQKLQLIRQCTAAKLNLKITEMFNGDCSTAYISSNGINIEERINYCCESVCPDASSDKAIIGSNCIEDLTEFNYYTNTSDPLDSMELCPNTMLGTTKPCSSSPSYCNKASGNGIINDRSRPNPCITPTLQHHYQLQQRSRQPRAQQPLSSRQPPHLYCQQPVQHQ